ncbi:hypothetical protein [Polyangium mundeleinium]|uniref:PH domain-containing protein n=1 Tax=Polyangium mundeleinium TaxID=2995306 RepID=A0ABT5ER62_9BACT|nr:hypothetical protein [Polyangium mundeleinium]MDC0744305.1 hypothetical protein [Polyangium mundeleinium]
MRERPSDEPSAPSQPEPAPGPEARREGRNAQEPDAAPFPGAKVHDAEGAGWRRFGRALVGPLLPVLGLGSFYTPLGEWFCDLPPFRTHYCTHTYRPLLVLLSVLALVWPWVMGRRRSRVARLRIRPGLLEVNGRGLLRERIGRGEVKAVRSARALEGTSVIIARRHGLPVFLEIEREEDARAIMYALAGPAAESGAALEIPGARGARDTIRLAIELGARGIGLMLCGVAFVCHLGTFENHSFMGVVGLWWPSMAIVYLLGAFACAILSLALRFFGQHARGAPLVLGATELRTGDGLRIPYRDIDAVKVGRRGLELLLAGAGATLEIRLPGLSAEERAHVSAHLLAGARGAEGAADAPSDVPARIAALSRSKHEPVRAWLARLDASVRARESEPYRGVPLDRRDLAETIGDPAAFAAVRAGAARVLWRIDPEVAREAVRDLNPESDRDVVGRLRLVMQEDIDEASERYEELAPPFRVFVRRDAPGGD